MNHPTTHDCKANSATCQTENIPNYHRQNGEIVAQEIGSALSCLMDEQFLCDLEVMRHNVSSGFQMKKHWKAYMLSYLFNIDCTNDLIRRLEESPRFVEICGFDTTKPLPSRWTFDRFVTLLADNPEPIQRLLSNAISELKRRLPDFGATVAIDSTSVRSHSNPSKKIKSDPEANFMVKEGSLRKVWKWGYKMHLIVDTVWELPIACDVTSATQADISFLIPMINLARDQYSWFKPWHVVADSGYDAGYNYKTIYDIGAIPIIKMKRTHQNEDNRYSIDESGIPRCQANLPLLCDGRDRVHGIKYLCPHRAGRIKCTLSHKCTLKVAWLRPFWEYRKFCSVPRDSNEWLRLYSQRSSVERVFSKLKEHRRLDSHCHRGLAKVKLHCLMSVLSLVMTALAELNSDHISRVRTCTRKVGQTIMV